MRSTPPARSFVLRTEKPPVSSARVWAPAEASTDSSNLTVVRSRVRSPALSVSECSTSFAPP